MSEDDNKKNTNMGVWIALGAGFGTAMGAATQNMGMWLALGMAIGVAIGAYASMRKPGQDED